MKITRFEDLKGLPRGIFTHWNACGV